MRTSGSLLGEKGKKTISEQIDEDCEEFSKIFSDYFWTMRVELMVLYHFNIIYIQCYLYRRSMKMVQLYVSRKNLKQPMQLS